MGADVGTASSTVPSSIFLAVSSEKDTEFVIT
jgi:hypothetical protein